MDGVLTDFVGSVLKLFGKEDLVITQENMVNQLGITEEEFWNTIDGAGVEFWSEMKETPECDQIIDLVKRTGCTWFVSTSPNLCENSVIGKVRWLKNKFGYFFNNYMIGSSKYLMAGPNRILIDDFTKNCSKFRTYGGQAIIVPRTYNPLSGVNTVEHVKVLLNKFAGC